jgi:hypothetical protein
MAGEDFVQVQLSAAGVKMAGAGGTVQIVIGRGNFSFKAGESQRVTNAYDWLVLLKDRRWNGQPIFEVAPAVASAPTAPAPVVAPPPVTAPRPEVMAHGVPGFGVHPAVAGKEK